MTTTGGSSGSGRGKERQIFGPYKKNGWASSAAQALTQINQALTVAQADKEKVRVKKGTRDCTTTSLSPAAYGAFLDDFSEK